LHTGGRGAQPTVRDYRKSRSAQAPIPNEEKNKNWRLIRGGEGKHDGKKHQYVELINKQPETPFPGAADKVRIQVQPKKKGTGKGGNRNIWKREREFRTRSWTPITGRRGGKITKTGDPQQGPKNRKGYVCTVISTVA